MPATLIRMDTDEDLGAALSAARTARGLTQEEVEFKVGLTGGHLGKIEHGGKTWGKRQLRMPETLRWLLEFYGLTLMIVDRETAGLLTGLRAENLKRPHLEKKTGKPRPNSRRLFLRMVRSPE